MPRAYHNVVKSSRQVRNEVWISYFALVAGRSVIRIVGYTIKDWTVEVIAMLLHGISAYVLVCALQWQRRFRGRISAPGSLKKDTPQNYQQLYANNAPIADLLDDDDDSHSSSDNSPTHSSHNKGHHDDDEDDEVLSLHNDHNSLLGNAQSRSMHRNSASSGSFSTTSTNIASFLLSAEFIGFLFMMYYLVSTIVRVFVDEQVSSLPKYFQLSAVVLQRLLILFVLLIIVCMPPSKNFSTPSLAVRLIAVLSIIFNIPNDLPFVFWHEWTPWAHNRCFLYFFSFYDFITLSYIISLCLWMIFIVIEFHRSREQAMFHAFRATQAQLTFPDASDSDSNT